MRRFFSSIVFIGSTVAIPAKAENAGEVYGDRYANNSVYFEGLGLGLLYSLNYDRVIDDFALRVGATLVVGEYTSASGSNSLEPAIVAVPVTLSYIGSGSRWTMLEVGAGLDILHAGAGTKTVYIERHDSALTTPAFVGIVGLRYQPPKGGLQLRGGVSVLYGHYGLLPLWPYVSVGYSF